MNNIFRTLLSGVLAKVSSLYAKKEDVYTKAEFPKPNLSQNDPTQPDYVKGRTHWAEEFNGFIFTEQTVALNHGYGNLKGTGLFTVGNTYTVILDGVTYKTVAWKDPWGGSSIGNGAIDGADGFGDTECPFLCSCHPDYPGDSFIAVPDTDKISCVISITGKWTTIHKIDEKFMPFNTAEFMKVSYWEGIDQDVITSDVPDDIRFGISITDDSINMPLFVNVNSGKLGLRDKCQLSPLRLVSYALDLSTFTEQTFYYTTTKTDSLVDRHISIDILDTGSKTRFTIDLGQFPDGEASDYTEAVEKIVTMNGVHYLVSVTTSSVYPSAGTKIPITIKKMGSMLEVIENGTY